MIPVFGRTGFGRDQIYPDESLAGLSPNFAIWAPPGGRHTGHTDILRGTLKISLGFSIPESKEPGDTAHGSVGIPGSN